MAYCNVSCCKRSHILIFSPWLHVSDRLMASWRRSFATRSSLGTRRPRRTHPCLCPRPASQRTWTPSSWCHWSKRPLRPSWPASITWLSLRVGRVRSTPWWLQLTAWTTCVAWTPPGTPGSEGPHSKDDVREEFNGQEKGFCLIFLSLLLLCVRHDVLNTFSVILLLLIMDTVCKEESCQLSV